MPINVLIAEDSDFLRKVISEFFLNHESINVVSSVKTGKEAIKMVKELHPDVIILDLLIFDMNGLDTLELIMKEFPTPTIIISEINFQNLNNSMLALFVGAFDLIIKPGEFEVKTLSAFKEELLNKTLTAAQSCIKRINKEDNLLKRKTFLRQDIINKNFKLAKIMDKRPHMMELENKKPSFRQSIINENFKSGKQNNGMPFNLMKESSKEINSNKEEFDNIIPIYYSNKPNIRQDIVHNTFKRALLSSNKEESIELNEFLIKNKITKSEKPRIKKIDILKEEINRKFPNEEEPNSTFDKIVDQIPVKEISTKDIPILGKKDKKIYGKKNLIKRGEVVKKNLKIIPYNKKVKREEVNKIKRKKKLKKKTLQSVQELNQEITRNKKLQIPDLIPIKGIYLEYNVIVIGTSLGGPRTLTIILKEIPKDFPYPILIVQHLKSSFVEYFVKTLNDICEINVKVAENDEFIKPGVVYIAPGDNHMEISVRDKNACIKIYKGDPVNYSIPSIDVLFFSAARVFKNKTLALLLTGMGEDGVNGLGAIQRFGGKTISESQETSILYGMPKLAAERGVADLILPNYEIGRYLRKYAQLE